MIIFEAGCKTKWIFSVNGLSFAIHWIWASILCIKFFSVPSFFLYCGIAYQKAPSLSINCVKWQWPFIQGFCNIKTFKLIIKAKVKILYGQFWKWKRIKGQCKECASHHYVNSSSPQKKNHFSRNLIKHILYTIISIKKRG